VAFLAGVMGQGEGQRKEREMSLLEWIEINWLGEAPDVVLEEQEEPTWEETHPDDVCSINRTHRTY